MRRLVIELEREGGGYSRFPISNYDIDSPAEGGDDGAAAAVCSARQDSERNSRLRQKSWEPNSFRCCRTHRSHARGRRKKGGRPCTCSRHRARSCRPSLLLRRQGLTQGGDWGHSAMRPAQLKINALISVYLCRNQLLLWMLSRFSP